MANMTKYRTPDGTSYTVKDATARQAIEQMYLKFAPAYDPAMPYAYGAYCSHGGMVCRCQREITEPKAWDGQDWVQVAVLSELVSALHAFAPEYSDQKTYTRYEYCVRGNLVLKCQKAITTPKAYDAGDWTTVCVYEELLAIKRTILNVTNKSAITFSIGQIRPYDPLNPNSSGTNTRFCCSDFILCNYDVVQIKAIKNYQFVYYLYDENLEYKSAVDSAWITTDAFVENRGGYVIVKFAHATSFSQAFTAEEIAELQANFAVRSAEADIEILAAKTGISLTSTITVTIGQFNPATKKGSTRTDRAFTSFIFCTSAETVLTPVPGYAYVYYLYDSVGALTESHDTQYETVPYRLHNQGGYVVVMFAKISDPADSFDFSADDVAALEAATIATDRITDLERTAFERVDYGYTRRFSLVNNTANIGTTAANYERLFTSLIPCTAEEMLIPYVGYRYVYGLYDADFQSIAAYDTDFRTLPSIVKNKGGYVRIVFAPASGTLTDADVAKIRRNFRLHALPSHIIKINDSYDKPMFTLLDDDGRDNFPAYAAMLADRNARGTLAVIANNVGTGSYMSVAQLVALRDAGHDIISHTATHAHAVYGGNPNSNPPAYTNFALISDETIRNDLKASRDFLLKYGFNDRAIAWPWGGYPTGYSAIRNNPYMDGDWIPPEPEEGEPPTRFAEDQRLRYARIAHEVGFRYGVNSTGGIITSSDMDTMWMNRVPMIADNDEYPLEYYTGLIDQCVAANGWFILMTHANDDKYHNMKKVTDVVDYALGKGMIVDTLAKCYVKKRPPVNIGLYRDALDHITLGTSYII